MLKAARVNFAQHDSSSTLHIELLDESGYLFAGATMDIRAVMNTHAYLTRILERVAAEEKVRLDAEKKAVRANRIHNIPRKPAKKRKR